MEIKHFYSSFNTANGWCVCQATKILSDNIKWFTCINNTTASHHAIVTSLCTTYLFLLLRDISRGMFASGDRGGCLWRGPWLAGGGRCGGRPGDIPVSSRIIGPCIHTKFDWEQWFEYFSKSLLVIYYLTSCCFFWKILISVLLWIIKEQNKCTIKYSK